MGRLGCRFARLAGYDGGMRFTLKDLFAATMFIAVAVCAILSVARQTSRGATALAVGCLPWAIAFAIIGLIALLIGARERKVRDGERRRNSQDEIESDVARIPDKLNSCNLYSTVG